MEHQNKLQTAASTTISNFAKSEAISKVKSLLSLANLAGYGSNKLDEPALVLLAAHVTQDYHYATLDQIERAILNGIKGRYNRDGKVYITSITIYHWLEKGVPKKPFTKADHDEMFYGSDQK